MSTKIAKRIGSSSFIQSFLGLTGNTRTSVIFEIAFGLSSVLYNFYLSLYMKAQGITDIQIGYLISLGALFNAICAIFGGVITNRLGRKKTTYIFELIAWPGSVILYLLSSSFWMFALARIINSASMISTMSWHLMILEDADDRQRVHAFNLLTIINMALGIITPIGGLIVSAYGVVNSERGFLIFAAVTMITSMTLRNRAYTETSVGQMILKKNKSVPIREELKGLVQMGAFKAMFSTPTIALTFAALLLHGMFFTLGSTMSLYFAVYFTEVLKFDQSAVSVIGGINSAVLLTICIFVNPVLSKKITGLRRMILIMMTSIFMKITYSVFAITMPANHFIFAAAAIIIYSTGFGIGNIYTEPILAKVTEGIQQDRAGLYALDYTLSSVFSMAIASASGYLYSRNPHSIYIISIIVLSLSMLSFSALLLLSGHHKKRLPHT